MFVKFKVLLLLEFHQVVLNFSKLLNKTSFCNFFDVRHEDLFLLLIHIQDFVYIPFFLVLVDIESQVYDQLENMDKLLTIPDLEDEHLFNLLLEHIIVVIIDNLNDGLVIRRLCGLEFEAEILWVNID